ncbi:hypothetical protein DRO56_02315 [Candidatus Bathyarchaeota archaeon]|nr:MAG: hypothetical protein DRO56_02315 [Candidatus Bathyarchaeota archaeon]
MSYMPAISFSGVTSIGPFWKQILEGRKTQTCRRPRKRPIKEGDRLVLYWKQRIPRNRKPIHLIGVAVCTRVERKKYRDFAFDDQFARRDGFRDSEELRKWFGPVEVHGDEIYEVIHFKLLSKDGGREEQK